MSTLFTEDHEWLAVSDGMATIGITPFACEQLGELVYIELKESGESFAAGETIAVVESVKAASEINAPVDGEILDVNGAVAENPALVNNSPDSDGWFYKIKITDAAQLENLMDDAAYKEHTAP